MRWLLAGLVALGLTAALARAEAPGQAGKDVLAAAAEAQNEEGKPPKPILYREGKQLFDVNNPEDVERLLKRLRSGEAEHLTLEKESSFMEEMADLAIWTVLVFVIVLFILGRYAWKPILNGLQKREENIRASVEEAQRARDEAQKIRADLEQKMARAEEQVQQRLDEGRQAAQRQYEEMRARAKAEIQADRERAHREIESARDQALQQLWNQAADLAAAISSKALRRPLTPEDHRRLVEAALDELPRAGDGR